MRYIRTKATKKQRSRFITNAFVEYKPVHDIETIYEIVGSKYIYSNINMDFSSFLNKLSEHERSHNPAANKKTKLRYGVTFKFLLDQYRNHEELVNLTQEFIKKYENLPCFSFYKKEGEGNYLIIYLCERKFYPDGLKINTYAKNDRYRDKRTGRIAKYSLDNSEYLEKVFSAGDIIYTDVVYFSSKTTIFQFASTQVFEIAMEMLKQYFIELLDKLFSAQIEEGYSLSTYPVRNCHSFGSKSIAKKWNKCIRTINERLNYSIYVLQYEVDCWDEQDQTVIYNLFKHYEAILKEQSFKYSRWTVDINFYCPSTQVVKDAIEFLLTKFESDLTRVMNYLIPVFF